MTGAQSALTGGAVGDLLATAVRQHQAGRLDAAEAGYRAILASQPGNLTALELLATIAAQRGRLDDAVQTLDNILEIDPRRVGALANLAAVQILRGRAEDALQAADRGLAQTGLNAATAANLLNSRGGALRAQGRLEEALAALAEAVARQPDFVDAHHNHGCVAFDLRRYDEGRRSFARTLALRPDYPFARGAALGAQMRVCAWDGLPRATADLEAAIARGQPATQPFESLMLPDAALQKKAAQVWCAAKHPAQPQPTWPPRPDDARIHLGYFSGDVRNHASMHLAAGLFEHHDRSRFRLTLFVFGPTARDAMSERVEAAFDEVVDVRPLDDAAIAALARAKAVDIAIDLKGASTDHRLSIFAHRAAPVQVNYLAYPGTLGATYMDYIVADPVVVPEAFRVFYTEKVVSLSGCYQANDADRPISDRTFTRAECGLPENAFVFCSFNAAYKITPAVFDIWMRLLAARPGSVLWLFADNPAAMANLQREASARSVDPARLVFAPLLPAAEHLSRLRLADLVLDTYPIAAHTTASDALWAGVPVLTRTGQTFASRVAASLLTALGLPELITDNADAYEKAALNLSAQADVLAGLKQRLNKVRGTSALFDTALYARRLEAAFVRMHERRMAGLQPDHLTIAG